ncbi:hypothetical protein J0H58_16365 [bacterium]|nr:hypothetical protein [bacterium]
MYYRVYVTRVVLGGRFGVEAGTACRASTRSGWPWPVCSGRGRCGGSRPTGIGARDPGGGGPAGLVAAGAAEGCGALARVTGQERSDVPGFVEIPVPLVVELPPIPPKEIARVFGWEPEALVSAPRPAPSPPDVDMPVT